MKILILGGTGAMGQYLTSILSADGNHDIYVTTRQKIDHKTDIHYIRGNAHDNAFLDQCIGNNFDVIIDFMVYTSDEFAKRYQKILQHTEQYIFTSSARVYAKNDNPISETSKRILDISTDKYYLQTDEYALSKARQENMLFKSGSNNYTVLRPYITYSDKRLQFGTYELDTWAFRALTGHKIVFSEEMMETYTTMTYGYDVAYLISKLVGNKACYGEVYQIAAEQHITWNEVWNIYTKAFEKVMKKKIYLELVDSVDTIVKGTGAVYQAYYDRIYDRKFNSSKILTICEDKFTFSDIYATLEKCMTDCLYNNQNDILKNISSGRMGYFDRITKECYSVHEIRELGIPQFDYKWYMASKYANLWKIRTYAQMVKHGYHKYSKTIDV